jgi:hypothetical protein
MERNRWETAIRCLEVALHPNTTDDEVIAGVNGFRRTADGTPLSEMCRKLAGGHRGDNLSQENLDLRHRLEREQASQFAALRRLHEAEQLIHDLSEEIRAEQQNFAEFRAATAQLVDGLKDENFDLRDALEAARVAAARQARKASPFRDLLTAALNGEGVNSLPGLAPAPRHPWTA